MRLGEKGRKDGPYWSILVKRKLGNESERSATAAALVVWLAAAAAWYRKKKEGGRRKEEEGGGKKSMSKGKREKGKKIIPTVTFFTSSSLSFAISSPHFWKQEIW